MNKLRFSVLIALIALCCASFMSCGEDEPNEKAACTEDNDCADGQQCANKVCVAQEGCTDGTSTCEADVLVSCNNGQEERQRCNDGLVCQEEGTTASCITQICEPNEQRCINQRQYSLCNEAGTAREDLDCPTNESCRDGACVEAPCEPFEVGCLDDDAAYSCDGAGVLTMLPCDEGKTCRDSVCTDQVCLPDLVICEEDTLVECSANGMSETRTDCTTVLRCQDSPNGCLCQEGACIEQ